MKQQSLEAEAVLYMPVAYFSAVFNTDRVYYGRTVCLFTRADDLCLISLIYSWPYCEIYCNCCTVLTRVQWTCLLRASPITKGVDLSWCPCGKQLLWPLLKSRIRKPSRKLVTRLKCERVILQEHHGVFYFLRHWKYNFCLLNQKTFWGTSAPLRWRKRSNLKQKNSYKLC